MTSHDLYLKLNDMPFQPFRIRMSNNSAIDVLNPGTVVIGESSAIVPLENGLNEFGEPIVVSWKTVALAHMVEFINISPPKSGKRKRAS